RHVGGEVGVELLEVFEDRGLGAEGRRKGSSSLQRSSHRTAEDVVHTEAGPPLGHLSRLRQAVGGERGVGGSVPSVYSHRKGVSDQPKLHEGDRRMPAVESMK